MVLTYESTQLNTVFNATVSIILHWTV